MPALPDGAAQPASVTVASWGFVHRPMKQLVECNSPFPSSSLKPSGHHRKPRARGCTPLLAHPSQKLVPGRGGERPWAAVPREGWGGSALPAASRLLNLSLAAKDTHVCIKLLSSQSNSGTSDSNYRYITGTDKSGARQHGTADAPWGAQTGCILSHPLPALFWGSLCAARPPGTPCYTGAHPAATSPIPLWVLFGNGAPVGFYSPRPCSGGCSCICWV